MFSTGSTGSTSGAQLFAGSIETPFSQNAFRSELGLEFPLISDPTGR